MEPLLQHLLQRFAMTEHPKFYVFDLRTPRAPGGE
jgi:hypothetical protein